MSAFQFIFDNAESISINKRPTVATTITRDNTVRAVKRGGDTWRFEVKLPDGIPWTELRPYIEQAESLGRHTGGVAVQINNAGYNSWLTNYRGTAGSLTGFAAKWTRGDTFVSLGAAPSMSSGFYFKAGDIIQLGTSGRCYSVIADVPYGQSTVQLNRPVLETTVTTNIALNVGPNCVWRVICTQMPTWTIFARDQVMWSGAFQFYEDTQYAYA